MQRASIHPTPLSSFYPSSDSLSIYAPPCLSFPSCSQRRPAAVQFAPLSDLTAPPPHVFHPPFPSKIALFLIVSGRTARTYSRPHHVANLTAAAGWKIKAAYMEQPDLHATNLWESGKQQEFRGAAAPYPSPSLASFRPLLLSSITV